MPRYETVRNRADTSVPPAQPGGSFCPPYSIRGNDVVLPGCGRPVRPLCDVQEIALRTPNVAPLTPTPQIIAPIRTNYFQPLAVRHAGVGVGAPNANMRFEVHQVTINGFPQTPFSNPAPDPANTSVLLSDAWIVPEGYGVPIAWGILSQANLIYTLNIGVLSRQPAGVDIDIYTWLFGNSLETVPAGYELGKPLLG